MIEILNCTKIFKKNKIETKALNNVTLKINNTGFVFIVGKSGSGKSTLLNLIANFDSASSGTIKYDDIDLSSLKEKERDEYLFNEVGFVFQAYNLFEELSVKENIALGFKNNSKSLKEDITKLLQEVDLEGYQDKLVKNLSGGEKQRVALARALIKNPKILLCDEPCGNLDNINSRKVLDILKRRSKESLVLIVSHSLNDAYLYADRIITLEEGKVVSDKYVDESESHDGIYVIKDLNNISNEEYDFIKSGILNKEIHLIRSRKELFKDFDKTIEPSKRNKVRRKTNFLKSFFSNLKLINSKIFKVGAFALITSFSLAIFSSILTLERFDQDEFNKKAVLSNSSEIISYDKSFYDGKEINERYLGKVTEDDKNFLKENYSGRYFERKAFSIHTENTSYHQANNLHTIPSVFNSFYSNELFGLNIVDETYLKDILDIDEVVILNETEYKNGVYITDYFADAMCFHNKCLNYEEMIKKYNTDFIYFRHNYAKIKGIIKTNYKEKLKPILDAVDNGEKMSSLIKKEENFKYYDYLRLALNSAYTFDKDIVKNIDTTGVYVHWINCELGELSYSNYCSINIPKENTLLLQYNRLSNFFPLLSKDEVEKKIKGKQFGLSFVTNPTSVNIISRGKVKVYLDLIDNYTKEIKEQGLRSYNGLVTPDLFKTFKEQAFYTTGYFFDDVKIYDLNKDLRERYINLNNAYYTSSRVISEEVTKFHEVFKTLNIFCLTLSLFIMIYYAFSVIKDNKYNIGVLKSLGYRGNEISVFFFTSFLAYFLATGGLIAFLYNYLTNLLNEVMVYNLSSATLATKITSVPIISFDANIFLVVLSSLLILSLLFSLIYLFVLRKYKIIRVIQNKE